MKHTLIRLARHRITSKYGTDVLSLLFFLGLLVGAFWGCFSHRSGIQFFLAQESAVLDALACSFAGGAVFLTLLMLAGTSYLGLLFIPAIVLLKAFFFGCAVAACFASFAWRGLLRAALTHAIPALLFLPAFFLCAQQTMASSGRLCSMRFRSSVYLKPSCSFVKAGVCSAAFMLLHAVYEGVLLPGVLDLVF